MRARNWFVGCCFTVLIAASFTANCQEDLGAARGEVGVSKDLLDWDKGPAGFLLTKQERKDWKSVNTAARAERFIELFWVRRNPDPSQPFNRFKADFESRVRYADDNFSYDGGRGALSDRAKVLYLLGTPHFAENRFPTETVERMDDTAAGTDEVRANAVLWAYDPARMPKEFKAKGTRIVFTFYEEKPETNNFTLDRSHRDATLGMRLLSRAPDVYLVHADLTELPRPVSVPGGSTAAAAHLDWLDLESTPFGDRATILSEPGLADANNRPLWFHLELPAEAPTLDLIAGRVSQPDGEVVSTFEIAAEPKSVGDHSAYHLTFPLAEGTYRLEVAGAAGGEPQVGYSSEVTVPGMPVDGPWLSPIWVGLEAVVQDEVLLGAPYCFGRLHLMPLTGGDVSRSDEVSYFGFVVRPGASEDDQTQIASKITLRRDGKRLGRPLDMPITGVRIADDVYAYANSIQLAGLPETGVYSLEFEIADTVGEVSVERTVELNVVD